MTNLADGKTFVALNGGNMDFGLTIFLAIAAILIIWFIVTYNSLISKKNKVKESFASIDVQLKKRYDLIPNILTIAKKYMEHERGLFENVTALRAQAIKIPDGVENIESKLQLDSQIAKGMGQLMVNMENYPQIKADETMIQAMRTYNEIEEHIAAARRFYNSAVLEMNNACELFPSNVVAGMFNFKQVPFFKVEDEKERERVDASQFL